MNILGSRAALICIWSANDSNEQKVLSSYRFFTVSYVFCFQAIVKSFTGLVINCCKDEFARRTLFGIFDFFGDSERVIKTIVKVNNTLCLKISHHWSEFIQVIADNLSDVIYDRNGIWVLHYLVHPRDYRVFGKGMIEILAQVIMTFFGNTDPIKDYCRARNLQAKLLLPIGINSILNACAIHYWTLLV